MTLAYTFFPTATTLATDSLARIRAYDRDDAVEDSGKITDALQHMNYVITSWQAHGLQVWCRKVSSALTMVSSQGSYTMGASGANFTLNRPLRIMQAWIRKTSDNSDIPLEIITQEKYYSFTNKTTEGTPVALYYDAAYDGEANEGTNSMGTAYLWPEPSSTIATDYRLYIVYQRPFLDYVATTDILDMPQEWYNAVRLNVALAMAPEYGMPALEYDRLRREAMEALDLALGNDTEYGSVFIYPESQ